MPKERVTVTVRREHTAIALTPAGEEIILYRGNLGQHQRNPTWDWETVTIGTSCRCTIISADRVDRRRRGVEIDILDP
jgi:hypothetical protein